MLFSIWQGGKLDEPGQIIALSIDEDETLAVLTALVGLCRVRTAEVRAYDLVFSNEDKKKIAHTRQFLMEFLNGNELASRGVNLLDLSPRKAWDVVRQKLDQVAPHCEIGVFEGKLDLDSFFQVVKVFANCLIEGIVLLHSGNVVEIEGAVDVSFEIVVVLIDRLDSDINVLNRVFKSFYICFHHSGIFIECIISDQALHFQELGSDVIRPKFLDPELFALVGVAVDALELAADKGGVAGGV